MTTPFKLALYAVALVAVFAAAFGLGSSIGPTTRTSADDKHLFDAKTAPATQAGEAASLPGLAVSQAGYTIVPAGTPLFPGADVPFSFTITGPGNRPVTAYTQTHEKDLHLIVVRRDMTGFQHVHPTRRTDGTWEVALNLERAGVYRAFADFQPAALGQTLVLGTDLFVDGTFRAEPLPVETSASRVDGYEVSLHGEPTVGRETELTFTVTKDGQEVELQPYLGAFGHLVSLRAGDLAYLHTHPVAPTAATEPVRFSTEFPTTSIYRLFLDFRVDDEVRTAEFTVTTPAVPTADASPSPTPEETSDGHAH